MKQWTSAKDTMMISSLFKEEMTAYIHTHKAGTCTDSKRTFRDFSRFNDWIDAQDVKNGVEYDISLKKFRIMGQMWTRNGQNGQDYITVQF